MAASHVFRGLAVGESVPGILDKLGVCLDGIAIATGRLEDLVVA